MVYFYTRIPLKKRSKKEPKKTMAVFRTFINKKKICKSPFFNEKTHILQKNKKHVNCKCILHPFYFLT